MCRLASARWLRIIDRKIPAFPIAENQNPASEGVYNRSEVLCSVRGGELSLFTAASVLAIEIAYDVRTSGTRLDPIIIGMLSRSFTRWNIDSGQLLRV